MWKIIGTIVLIVGIGFGAIVGCQPFQAPHVYEIDSSDTCFLVPLEGDGQAGDAQKFGSEEYLNQQKVAAKRVTIGTRWLKTGIMGGSGQYIETQRLICVNRAPVARAWTKEKGTGTGTSDEAVYVETLDSIGLGLGVVINAAVLEEDTAKYLYWYAGKQLTQTIDTEVRGFVIAAMNDAFNAMDFNAARAGKVAAFDAVKKLTQDEFKARGITITNFGLSEGLIFDNPAIQEGIDNNAAAQEQTRQAAEIAKKIQIENKQRVETEKANAEVVNIQAQAEADRIAKINAAIQSNPQYVELERIKRWNGSVPNTFIIGEGQDKGVLTVIAPNTVVSDTVK